MIHNFIQYLIVNPLCVGFILLWITAAALWRRRKGRKRRRLWLTGSVVLVSLICMPWMSYLALRTLEAHYGRPPDLHDGVDAIVVLSGGLRILDEEGETYELQSDTMGRCTYALRLHQRLKGRPILVTGGDGSHARPGPSLGEAMAEFLQTAGVDPDLVIVEGEASNTRENALFSKPLLEKIGARRIILVTDATHMHRSIRCFRQLGFEVVPAACNFRTVRFEWSLYSFLPSPGAALGLGAAAHEWVGMLWYWLNGWI